MAGLALLAQRQFEDGFSLLQQSLTSPGDVSTPDTKTRFLLLRTMAINMGFLLLEIQVHAIGKL